MIYKCNNCGGNVLYHPGKKAMHCPHCDSLDCQSPYQAQNAQNCDNCGAPIETQEETTALKCSHCSNYIILENRMQDKKRPNVVLPFLVDKEAAKEFLKKEFSQKSFAPSNFLSNVTLESMEGQYVPFFLYDYNVDYQYKGEGTKIKTWVSGDMEYTETSYYNIERDMKVSFSRIPVDASVKMEDGIMDLLEPFQYQNLEEFQEKYLSGFIGENYTQDSTQLEPRATQKVDSDSKLLMQESIAGYARVTSIRDDIRRNLKKSEYALLPVWVYVFQYQGKNLVYHVNGQTGKVIGKLPISVGKAIGYSAAVFASVASIATLALKILEVL